MTGARNQRGRRRRDGPVPAKPVHPATAGWPQLAFLAANPGGAAVREIAAALGATDSPWKVREDLATLKTLGLVKGSGWGRGARWTLVSP